MGEKAISQNETSRHDRITVESDGRKESAPTFSGKNASDTTKLAAQFVATEIDVARPLAPAPNSSETKNHGIEPGPDANIMMNTNTAMIEIQERKAS